MMTYAMPAEPQPVQKSGSAEMPAVGSPSTYRFPRRGARPVTFRGTELAMAMSFTPEIPFWYEINIFRTTEEGFVVAIKEFFQAEESKDSIRAWTFPTLGEVFDHIEGYDAGADVKLPNVDLDAAAPAELAAMAMDLKARVSAARHHFAGLVGELFAEMEAAGVVPK